MVDLGGKERNDGGEFEIGFIKFVKMEYLRNAKQ